MRLEKAAMLLELARKLASSPEGLTLDEMALMLGVHRRTAQRFRDALQDLFPAMEETPDGKTKRWRITNGLDGLYHNPTPEELSALTIAADAFRRQGATVRAEALDSLAVKIKSAMRGKALSRLVPDVDALVRAERIAVQAGPRPIEDEALLAEIRLAILSMRFVQFAYSGGSKPGTVRRVVPYGLMFGRTTYLVGAEEGSTEPRNWRIDRMSGFVVCNEAAATPVDFDLHRYANASFGVFRDKIEDVVLRVSPAAQREAIHWQFHPDQRIEPLEDGGFRVRFRASGMLELAWHLFTWRTLVTVEAPERLRQIMREEAAALAIHALGGGGRVS
jgi:predicted DNA-binding transcriptional regulator YafY